IRRRRWYPRAPPTIPTEAAPPRYSEEELYHQLDVARQAHRVRDLAERVHVRDVPAREGEARGVGQVEGLRPELQIPVAPHVEAFREDGVDVPVAWRARRPHPAVAEGAEGRPRESVNVQPVVDALVGGHRVAHAVRPLHTAHGLERRAAAVLQGDGDAGAGLE